MSNPKPSGDLCNGGRPFFLCSCLILILSDYPQMKFMTLRFLFFFGAAMFLFSCSSKRGNVNDVISKAYSEENLPKQEFAIRADRDTLLVGKSGTTVHIEKDIFTDSSGHPVSGNVNIELKEALGPLEMILSNLTTTSNGQSLESGGMIYLNATSEGKQLFIKESKAVNIGIPSDSILANMQLFEGVKDSVGFNWINPVRLEDVKPKVQAEEFAAVKDSFRRQETNVAYNVKEFPDGNEPHWLDSTIWEIIWKGNGLVLKSDSSFMVGEYNVRFYKQDSIWGTTHTFRTTINSESKGSNYFQVDEKTNYIFAMKKLGWANIDRLQDDPRTKDVDLIVTVSNQKEFDVIYITMMIMDREMYLPGYQKKDETFSFTHGDFETTKLPVGAEAVIIATAYKDDKPFFVLKKVVISEKQRVDFSLEETTMENIKAKMQKNI